jgi:hypothetical protein
MNPVATNLQATYASTAYADALGVLVRGLYQPHNWTELAVEFAAMAISGLIIGAITARQVSERRRAY